MCNVAFSNLVQLVIPFSSLPLPCIQRCKDSEEALSAGIRALSHLAISSEIATRIARSCALKTLTEAVQNKNPKNPISAGECFLAGCLPGSIDRSSSVLFFSVTVVQLLQKLAVDKKAASMLLKGDGINAIRTAIKSSSSSCLSEQQAISVAQVC
jgi:hypothetical protein